MIKRMYSITALLLACAVSGCLQGDTKHLPEPNLDPKADVASQVNLLGHLDYSTPASGSFEDDLQFDAYTFKGRADARITLEITHQGSSNSLDDYLLLYGPADSNGRFSSPKLTKDDDSGWGPHARLKDFELSEEGLYLAVIGTAEGEGRGNYRLLLTCLSETCKPDAPEIEGCPDDLWEDTYYCMEAEIYDEGENPTEALSNCMFRLEDAYYDKCDYSSNPPDWCGLDYETFEAEIIPACEEDAAEEYPPWGLNECDESIYYHLEECVESAIWEQDADPEDAINSCTSETKAESAWESVCLDSYNSPSWCQEGLQAFLDTMLPDCKSWLTEVHNPEG